MSLVPKLIKINSLIKVSTDDSVKNNMAKLRETITNTIEETNNEII